MLRLKKFGRLPLYAFLIFCCLSTVVFSDDSGEEIEPEVNGTSIRASFSEEDQDQLKKAGETHRYQAEVNRLMDIIINSLYTQKEVFLRELISNAADALEKARFASVTDKSLLDLNPEFEIRIEADKEAKTLTIMDTGIGMGKKELVNNLGTVARSGTTNFLEALSSGADLNLIGQFGVGFYSAFLVADKVTVVSKSPSDPVQHVWESSADASFTVSADPRGITIPRGTQIILHLKEDATQFLEDKTLRDIINRFNQYVNFPIYLWSMKEGRQEVPLDDPRPEEFDPFKEKPKEGDPPPTTKAVKRKVLGWEHVNQLKPIWLRPKEEITEAEYSNFFIVGCRDYFDPLAYTHFSAEGDVEFKSILFLPRHPPVDDWAHFFNQKQGNIRLYSRRILIADESYELMPRWLSFVKGVVDSDDLPLKVDRESLSQTKMMQAISKKLVSKVVDLVRKLSKEDRDEWDSYLKETDNMAIPAPTPQTKYVRFWKSFAKNMKMGCIDDEEHRDRVTSLFRWQTTKTKVNQTFTLDEYIQRMPEDQKHILFLSHDNYDAALQSPHLKIYLKKDWEVIIASDPLDETCLQKVRTFRTRPIHSIERIDSNLLQSKDEKKRWKQVEKAYKPLIKFLTSELDKKIGRIKLSQKLVEDAAVVTSDSHAIGAYTERVIKSQSYATYYADQQNSNRILDLNPNHPLSKKLLELVIADPKDPQAKALAVNLLETALFASGYNVPNPIRLTAQLYSVMMNEAGVPSDAIVEDFVVDDSIPLEEDEKPAEETPSEETSEESTEESTDEGSESSTDGSEDKPHEIKFDGQSPEDLVDQIKETLAKRKQDEHDEL